MKTRNPSIIAILSTGLLVAGIASAQTQSQPMQSITSPTQSSSDASANNTGTNAGNNGSSATFNTAKGQVTINSTMGPAPSTASPPSFEQLANGKKYISKTDALAYPPLANDFEYAAHKGSRISKAQYERWVKDLN